MVAARRLPAESTQMCDGGSWWPMPSLCLVWHGVPSSSELPGRALTSKLRSKAELHSFQEAPSTRDIPLDIRYPGLAYTSVLQSCGAGAERPSAFCHVHVSFGSELAQH